MTDREEHIREIAYFLWLKAGCPEGQAERHWLEAEARYESDPKSFESQRIKGAPLGDPARNSSAVSAVLGASEPSQVHPKRSARARPRQGAIAE